MFQLSFCWRAGVLDQNCMHVTQTRERELVGRLFPTGAAHPLVKVKQVVPGRGRAKELQEGALAPRSKLGGRARS